MMLCNFKIRRHLSITAVNQATRVIDLFNHHHKRTKHSLTKFVLFCVSGPSFKTIAMSRRSHCSRGKLSF